MFWHLTTFLCWSCFILQHLRSFQIYAIGAQETNINRYLSHDSYQLHLFDSSTLHLFGQMLQTKLYPWLGFYLEMEMFLRTQDPAKSLLLYCWLHLSPKFHIKLTYLKSHLLEPSSFLFLYMTRFQPVRHNRKSGSVAFFAFLFLNIEYSLVWMSCIISCFETKETNQTLLDFAWESIIFKQMV